MSCSFKTFLQGVALRLEYFIFLFVRAPICQVALSAAFETTSFLPVLGFLILCGRFPDGSNLHWDILAI